MTEILTFLIPLGWHAEQYHGVISVVAPDGDRCVTFEDHGYLWTLSRAFDKDDADGVACGSWLTIAEGDTVEELAAALEVVHA